MGSFDIKPNFDIARFSRQAEMFPKSGMSAINRIAKEARSGAAKEVSERYNIKRTEVLDKIKVIPANQNNLVARIRAQTRRLTVMRFNARESALARGVVLEITKGNAKGVRKAFIAKVKVGGTKGKLVLARIGDARYPLEAVRTISISEMLGTKKVGLFLGEYITKRLPEEMTRLIELWNK